MRRPVRIAAVAAAAILVPLVGGGFLAQERGARNNARLLDQVLDLVSERYVDTVGTATLYEHAAKGLVRELNDPYSELLTPKQLSRFTQNTNGRYGGIGMQIEPQEGSVVVSRVFPNTPAEQAGVREGDRIVQIDTTSTRGWTTSQVSEVLTGTPGTKVTVKFQRPGSAEFITKLTRAIIRVPAVHYAIMLDGGIGYIPLIQFNETAASELERQVRRLQREGARSFIVDLRDNPGGILEQALTISNFFLGQGQDVLSVRGRGVPPQVLVADNRPIVPTAPLVVLVDGGSASASEIVAGALQDHDRALVVGTTSFGKGLVQTLFTLEGGYALKITTAKWYTPSGRSIQKERKFVDGRFVEEDPDSLETDSVKKTRPAFRSDAGRIVYGGGAITPDVIIAEDTISTAEQALAKVLAAKSQIVYTTLSDYALELKPALTPNFTLQPAWREELHRRLQRNGVTVDRAIWEAGGSYVDRALEQRISRLAFGDSTAKRRFLPYDAPLRKAVELLRKGQTQRDLFTVATASARRSER
jgi:carboxyl-terminal processing protease